MSLTKDYSPITREPINESAMKLLNEGNLIPIEAREGRLSRAIKRVTGAIKKLFQPEEVEVTFKVVGKHVRYTYTKVEEHKQVA